MPSLDGLKTRFYAGKQVARQVGADTSIAFTLDYIGTGSVTSVTVTTATNIVMVTSDGGTDTYAFATYTTLGTLVDKINSDGIFKARIVDGLRSQSTGSSALIDGAITVSTDGLYRALWDTSACLHMTVRLFWGDIAAPVSKLNDSHRVTLKEIVTSLTLGGGADANSMKIYECTPNSRGSVESLLIQRTPTSGSVVTLNWASGQSGITTSNGNELVVVVTDGTSFGASDYITISGFAE